jgi:hypothetical protein
MPRWLILAVSLLLALTGCGGEGTGAGMSANSDRSLYDRDSRNNENPSLGVKNRPNAEVSKLEHEFVGRDQLDPNNPHYTESMQFAPAIAQQLAKMPGIESAQVILTDVNAYVAVKLKGIQHSDQNNMATDSHSISGKSGRGLFGSGVGLQMNWADTGGLTMSMNDEITKKTLDLAPAQIQKVYVTANPNFVERVRFYSEEEKRNGSWINYKHEFNTLVQHAFPADTNTRK